MVYHIPYTNQNTVYETTINQTNHSLRAAPIHRELGLPEAQRRREVAPEMSQQDKVATPANQFTNT